MVAADASSSSSEVVGEKSSNKMITLVSSDGERFDVTEASAAMSETIKHMIEDDCVDNGIPLSNVTANILSKVIEYCNKHAAADGTTATATAADNNNNNNNDNTTSTGEQDLKSFDASFVAVDQATLFEIILAANYLSIKGLLDLCCQTVADNIKDLSPEEVRKLFNIQNDFTPDEEKEIREANAWAFQ